MESENMEQFIAPEEESISSVSSSAKSPEKKRLSVSEKTTTASERHAYDKTKEVNPKDDIWWEQRGSKSNKHVPTKDPKSPTPKTGNFLTPTAATVAGSKPKYYEPAKKQTATPTKAIPQDSHLLAPTPASLHSRAKDDTLDQNRKDVTQPVMQPVPAQYKDVTTKLLEPTAALKAAAFISHRQPSFEDERERQWVANTKQACSMSKPLPEVPKVPHEKRPADKSTLLKPTAASKGQTIEAANAPPPAPAKGQERIVSEEYAHVASRLHEETATSIHSKKEKSKASPSKAFSAGSKTAKLDTSPKAKPPVSDQYANVQSRLHESTAAADSRKKKLEEDKKSKEGATRRQSGSGAEYKSHLLTPTTATKLGEYHKPEAVVEEPKKSTKAIPLSSHLLTPTPASVHASTSATRLQEAEHKPKLEASPGYEHVQSRLHDETAAHKNSAYVKKEKPTLSERESQWDQNLRQPSPAAGDDGSSGGRHTPAKTEEYKSVASRLHQDTAAHKNSAYVKKEDTAKHTRRKSEARITPPLPTKTRRKSAGEGLISVSTSGPVESSPNLDIAVAAEDNLVNSVPSAASEEYDISASVSEHVAESEAQSASMLPIEPEPVRSPEPAGEVVAPVAEVAAGIETANDTVELEPESEATQADDATTIINIEAAKSVNDAQDDDDDKEKEFMIGELKEVTSGVEQVTISEN